MKRADIIKETNYALASLTAGMQEDVYNTLKDLSDQLTKEENNGEKYINIKELKCGQPKPYADSEFEYIITTNYSKYEIQRFCQKYIRNCEQEKKDWKTGVPESYFKGYYTFEEISPNVYKYYVLEPYAD